MKYLGLTLAEKQNHHIFPLQFRENFKQIAKGKFDIDAFAVRMNEVFHLKGLHGGGYNRLWKNFLDNNAARIKKDPMFAIGFGLGLMNELGFGNFGVIPY